MYISLSLSLSLSHTHTHTHTHIHTHKQEHISTGNHLGDKDYRPNTLKYLGSLLWQNTTDERLTQTWHISHSSAGWECHHQAPADLCLVKLTSWLTEDHFLFSCLKGREGNPLPPCPVIRAVHPFWRSSLAPANHLLNVSPPNVVMGVRMKHRIFKDTQSTVQRPP
jgi:hypothetical protein